MFLNSSNDSISGRVCAVGEFSKIDGEYVILKSNKGTIKAMPRGFESYKTKYLLIIGNFENGVLFEESVQKIEDDFDFEVFSRLSKQVARYSEVFWIDFPGSTNIKSFLKDFK